MDGAHVIAPSTAKSMQPFELHGDGESDMIRMTLEKQSAAPMKAELELQCQLTERACAHTP